MSSLSHWKEHEALLRSREDTEKQLEEQKKSVEVQKKRYAEMEARVLLLSLLSF